MTSILGIPGSVRRGSWNGYLLQEAARLAPDGFRIDMGSIRDIPLYDGDTEAAQGVPQAVTALKDRLASSNGLLLVTPEYNGSMPGVLKNAIDWMSRPAADIARVFGKKPVAILGATPGRGGTRLAQAAWLPVFRQLEMVPWFGKSIYVTDAKKVFDADGKLVDEQVKKMLTDFVAGFAAFVKSFS